MTTPPRILITGAAGQLGSEFARLTSAYRSQVELLLLPRQTMDITADTDTWTRYLTDNAIAAVINTAAYTQVDKAETAHDEAFAINAEAVKRLSRACAAADCALLHYSTDFVFDGKKNTPYTENDAPMPLGVYAESKYGGELAALAENRRSVVLRTSWVYSSMGNNFVKTMLRLSAERAQINVVYDQIGSPTSAADLAKVTLDILPALLANVQHDAWGQVFHYANEGVTSWFDLAYQVVQLSGNKCQVRPIETRDYPTPARRPSYSVLATDKIKRTFGIEIPYWRDSLLRCLAALLRQ